MARGQRDLVLERQWRERLREWTSSGLGIRTFCRRRGLPETAFYYWRRELRARDEAAARGPAARDVVVAARTVAASAGPSASDSQAVMRSNSGKKSQPTFVPVTVIPDAMLAVEVRCPSGHVVVLSSCAAADLGLLFAALAPQASLVRGSQACRAREEAQPC